MLFLLLRHIAFKNIAYAVALPILPLGILETLTSSIVTHTKFKHKFGELDAQSLINLRQAVIEHTWFVTLRKDIHISLVAIHATNIFGVDVFKKGACDFG